ncbi:MAG: hypothetical protein EOP62_19130 [Sphingomonadales bacterium]|nr:MAG: hypothetical protein EOP62_19130 [Sphingomonadales bacterium]
MGAIRIFGGLMLLFAAMPVCAQSVEPPRIAFTTPHTETNVTFDDRSSGLWLRASTVTRDDRQLGGTDGRTGYRFSLQKQIIGHTWIGIGSYTQLPRFDPIRGETRGARNAIGPKLSFEASGDVELGLSWMKRKRRGAPPPGPRAYVQFNFR